jgi:predicted dehydrogenase
MALAAIAAGKHVYCEKPLAALARDALEAAEAAEAAGVKTQVGFNYLCNPMLQCARNMILAGELGEIRGYRGIHCEDYMADASALWTFRHGLVTYLCRSKCSFRPLGVRRPRGFSLPMLNVGDVDYRSRLCIGR